MSGLVTIDQKRRLYHDGYLILKNVVSRELVAAALGRIKAAQKGENLWEDPALTGLLNESSLTPILNELVGEFDPPTRCQIGIRKVSKPGDHFTQVGYREKDEPYYAAEMHVDGSCTIGIPQQVQTGSPRAVYQNWIASGPKGDIGRSADVMGSNMVPLFMDPSMTLGLGDFTTLVFICLNDQTREGCGQTSLLPGVHHEMEKFFRWQYEQNGHVGIEGPGWPRLRHDVPSGIGQVYLPDAVVDKLVDDASFTTDDGRKWPKPIQVLMEPGDACLAMFHTPHSGSRNEHGSESRKSIIFRVRNKKRQPGQVVNGVSDHPDRGQFGEWLDFEPGDDPWRRSKHALCNMWEEWEGMQEIVQGFHRERV